jgi:Kdo2-lipid IVA lauroyltransferase/acyltransferase
MYKVTYYFSRIAAGAFSYLPLSVLYIIGYILYQFLYRVTGYRKKVVFDNLQKVFPHYTADQKKAIARLYYKYLATMFMESLKAISLNREEVLKRHKILNPELLSKYESEKQSIIAVTGHYGNWEWGALSAPLQTRLTVQALYKRIKNPYIDQWMKNNRSRTGANLVKINDTYTCFEQHHADGSVFLMAADQGPGSKHMDKAYWLTFLGQETACLHGPEKYARKYNLPVVFLDIQPVKKGYYEITIEELVNNPGETNDGEITAAFMQRLEKQIVAAPQYWLWSHRRWRRSKKE